MATLLYLRIQFWVPIHSPFPQVRVKRPSKPFLQTYSTRSLYLYTALTVPSMSAWLKFFLLHVISKQRHSLTSEQYPFTSRATRTDTPAVSYLNTRNDESSPLLYKHESDVQRSRPRSHKRPFHCSCISVCKGPGWQRCRYPVDHRWFLLNKWIKTNCAGWLFQIWKLCERRGNLRSCMENGTLFTGQFFGLLDSITRQ